MRNKNIPIVMAGRAAVQTRDISQPVTNPTINPPIVTNMVITKVATFSPIAPYIAKHCCATCVASSFGLILSNHPISYLSMASK
jgi:hypothetical protein